MRTIILETRDGWRKEIKIDDSEYAPYSRMAFELTDKARHAARYSPIEMTTFHYKDFEYTGEVEPQRDLEDGTIYKVEIWRER